mgnify:CR=1 FL=1
MRISLFALMVTGSLFGQPPTPPPLTVPEGTTKEDFERALRERTEQMREYEQHMAREFAKRGKRYLTSVERSQFPRLGALLSTPSKALRTQLDLPKEQGLILSKVKKDSVAAKAGLKDHDILLELNEKPVNEDPILFAEALKKIKADAEITVVVLRKGKNETIKGIKLPKAKKVDPTLPRGIDDGLVDPAVPPGIPPRPRGVFPAIPPVPPIRGGGKGISMSMFRNGDRFTCRYQEGSLIISLVGTSGKGKAKVSKIHIQDGRESNDYKELTKVPERYQDKVKSLVEMVEKGNARIELKQKD